MKHKKALLSVIAAASLILIGIYIRNVVYFNNKLLPNTTIYGINCSSKTPEEANSLLRDKLSNTTYSVKENDVENFSFSASEIGLNRDFTDQLKNILDNQNSLGWFINSLGRKDKYDKLSNVIFNDEAFNTYLSKINLNQGTRTTSQDAYIDKTNDSFTIIEEIYGNTIDVKSATDKIKESILNDTTNIDIADCYIKPSILKNNANLIASLTKANKMKDIKVDYLFGTRVETVSTADKMSWLTFNGTNVDFDKEKIRTYIVALGNKYNTCGSTRSFQSTTNGVINVSGGLYGFYILTDSETEELYNLLSQGNPISRAPLIEGTGITNSSNDIGNTYVEVNKAAQHMWFYKNGSLVVDTDVVTGTTDGVHDTPVGVHYVLYKESPAILRGPGYAAPVSYWMPLTWDGVGIHDATWRSAFGGNIYTYDGSHGCINTPYGAVQTIFENIDAGTPVVIY
ncbi:L,D-transpeptidase family protein [Clostridium cellulovorans]|uniref:ErfK/YbiS/YcfS/YnhG family protein n=1 Tax=Clostridium cellulovorans (strain ATCC 35296 / DSM 3052 / OCM 3 / 743B) TaxID=573061 RepID=D9SVC5_CLOC7|nr:L,D-transpeptidase family protein [Clostridium cellulovorans]ADL51049.1 ErfK/YbiS/YcfS/YnhG family protein [Clostridium cellulovorans 743B]